MGPTVFVNCRYVFYLQNNRISKIEGLEALTNMEELYISFNLISKVEGLSTLTKLHTLDLSNNQIATIEGIATLTELEEFWFNDNKVKDWAELDKLIPMNTIQTVYLERNPIYYNASGDGKRDTAYRRKILLTLPWLRQLDATLTGVGLTQ